MHIPHAARALAAIILGLGLSGVAIAESGSRDPLCAVLKTLLDATPSGFAKQRGNAKQDAKDTWTSTLSIPDGTECLVFSDAPAAYTCSLYAGDKEADADWAYDNTVARVKKCLPEKWTTHEKVDGERKRVTVARGSGHPPVRVRSRIDVGEAYLVDFWIGGPRH